MEASLRVELPPVSPPFAIRSAISRLSVKSVNFLITGVPGSAIVCSVWNGRFIGGWPRYEVEELWEHLPDHKCPQVVIGVRET
jgi:hypothetical protein